MGNKTYFVCDAPEKAHMSDGMTPLFSQKFWEIVKGDLTHMVNNFLSKGLMAQGLNDTNICLIPKKDKHIVIGQSVFAM